MEGEYWQRDDLLARLRMEASINQGNAKLCGEAADEIERLRAERRWIPVSERLPEIGVSVLCSSPEPPGDDWVWIGQREEHEWYFPGANEMGTPTHWMPLPEPPGVK